MPATTDLLRGWAMSLAFGGNPVGAETNARLRIGAEFLDAGSKLNYAWDRTLNGERSWGVEFDALMLNSSGAEARGSSAALTVGGTALKGWTALTLDLQADFDPTVNSTVGLDRVIVPTTRRARLSIEGDYYDPLGTGAGALAAIKGEVLGDTTAGLAFVLTTGGGGSFTFTGRPGSLGLDTPFREKVTNGIEVASTGAVTNGTTGADVGLSALLTAFFNATGVQSGEVILDTDVATNQRYRGTTYPVSLRFTIPFRGLVTVAGTLEGSGALIDEATP